MMLAQPTVKPTAIPPVLTHTRRNESASSWPRPGQLPASSRARAQETLSITTKVHCGVYRTKQDKEHARYVHRAECSHATRFSICTLSILTAFLQAGHSTRLSLSHTATHIHTHIHIHARTQRYRSTHIYTQYEFT